VNSNIILIVLSIKVTVIFLLIVSKYNHNLGEMDFKYFLFMVVSPTGAALMIILNILEIWFIFKRKMLARVKSTVYILNLAISDILLGIFILTVKTLKTIEQNNGISSKYRLFFQHKMIYISLYVSVLTLAVLTIERVLAVKKPIFYKMLEYKKKFYISVSMWFITVFAITVHHITVNDNEKESIKTPLLILFIAFFICCSYLIILRTLKIRAQQRNMGTTTTDVTLTTFNQAEKRFLRFCIKSFIIFLVCWLPLAAYGVALAGGFITTWKYKDYFDFVTHIIAFWNSVASPIMFLHHNWKMTRRVGLSRTSNNGTVTTSST